MIKSHGTTDGFNTELPERLHIDIAKDAFDHTNKRDYIAQMCLRLQRHEAVSKFTTYLVWRVDGYIPGGKKQHRARPGTVADASVDPNNDDQISTDETPDGWSTTNRLPSANANLLQHSIAKKPPLNISLDTIRSKFGHHQFAETLKKFLHKSGSLHPSLQHAIENARFPVFKQFTIKIPSPRQVTSELFVDDTIHAREGEPGDTVLAKPGLLIDDNTPIKWWDIHGTFRKE